MCIKKKNCALITNTLNINLKKSSIFKKLKPMNQKNHIGKRKQLNLHVNG